MLQYAIVITGGIGSGKSTACNLLKLYGYSIIDADSIAHNALEMVSEEIVRLFGSGILSDTNATKEPAIALESISNKPMIDRKKLGAIVFADMCKREQLERLLHPMIRDEIYSQASKLEADKKPYFIDIPLFFEVNAKNPNSYAIERVLLIYAPKEVQIARVMKRNNLTLKEASLRVESQMDIEMKKAKATFVIDNSRDLSQMQAEIERFLKSLEK